LPIDYFSLDGELDEGVERWRCYYYYYFYSIKHRDRSMAYDIRNFSAYFLYRQSPGSMADVRDDFDSWGGFLGGSKRRDGVDFRKDALVAVKRHEGGNPENALENLGSLAKLCLELKRRNIRLVLVTMPVTSYYRTEIQPARWARVQGLVEKFCHENNVSYKDYFSDGRFTLDDFFDADHLNFNGAAKFSAILALEVQHAVR